MLTIVLCVCCVCVRRSDRLLSFHSFILSLVMPRPSGAETWRSASGVFLFGYGSVVFGLMSFFYYKAISSMRSMTMSDKGFSQNSVDVVRLAAQRLIKFGLLVLGGFLLTFGPVTVSALLSVFGVQLPLEWEMFAGLMTKLKGVVDCAILLNLPVVQKTRAHRVRPVSNQSTMQSRDLASRDLTSRDLASRDLASLDLASRSQVGTGRS